MPSKINFGDVEVKSNDNCSLLECDVYDQSQRNATNLLSRSITKLEIRNLRPGVKQDEIEDNMEKIADLKANLGILESQGVAFKVNRAKINPPTSDQLKVLKKNLDKVNELTTEKRILVEIGQITTEALDTIKEINPELSLLT